ncbi:mediator of RNA polymerase II transcription subunit 22-like [Mytilus californianus]|uniref:mediator of RNA polymerase II transcription subunit 22-like n=1 Tax=Mytilus californianus TaxID=6549 RepID=UPI0022470CF4|nr:mediator of RNA polymerase II transcription subunit 22-like [Mytilus californianus]
MSQPQRGISQTKEALLKTYHKKLKDDVRSMFDNFTEIIRLARVEEDSQIAKMTQTEQDQYEMQVRASNIGRAGESLMKLVSDLKQFLVLNDFPSVNESITTNTQLYKNIQSECDKTLMNLKDEMSVELFELEDEYYSSSYK